MVNFFVFLKLFFFLVFFFVSRFDIVHDADTIFHLPLAAKPQLHIHDFGHGRATIHPDLSNRDAPA